MRNTIERLAPLGIVAALCAAALTALALAPPSPKPEGHDRQATCEPTSRDEFLHAQREATFPIYCPTFLPQGFRLERFHFGLPKSDARGLVGSGDSMSLAAVFINDETGGELSFGQRNLGNDLFPNWRLFFAPPRQWPILYGGEVAANAYVGYTIPGEGEQPAVVWGSEDGHQHVITGRGVDAETLQTIADAMLRLGPLNHVQSAGR